MELTLFIIVGAVAILSAAMMLISENAVYSALFLILNFACIAFLFLLLNAPFLAMVQITVYAGAIMVLFLFVIMLLGAEQVQPNTSPRFRWFAPVAMVLAVVFVLTAGAAIIRGDIELTVPDEADPVVRVVHALDGLEPVDVYLDDVLLAEDVAYGEASDFESWDEGMFTVQLFKAGTDAQTTEPLATTPVEVNVNEALSFVLVGQSLRPALVVANEDTAPLERKDELRLVLVNGLPERPSVDVWDDAGTRNLLIEGVAYGEASPSIEVDEDDYTLGVYPAGNDRNRFTVLDDQEFEGNTSVLLVLTARANAETGAFDNVLLHLETDTRPTFGSPRNIGQLLFSAYVLPFELVSLLLLVAMIGAIVLTFEGHTPRRRFERRLANPPASVNQPAEGD